MDISLTLALGATAVVVYYFFYGSQDNFKRQLARIPGPAIWPIIGNLHFFDRRPAWIKTWHMARKYGPVMRLQIGPVPVVLLNSYEAIYDGLITQGKKLLTRPQLPRIEEATPNFNGVIFNESNDRWRVLRRAFLHNFKYYGSGKSHLEPVILDVLEDFIAELRATKEQVVDPRPIIFRYFGSIMYVLNFGRKATSEESFDLIEVFDQNLIQYTNPFGDGVELDVFPWYRAMGFGKKTLAALKKVATNSKKIWDTYGAPTYVNPDNPAFEYEEGRIHEQCFSATLKAIVAANRDKGFVEQHAQGTTADTFTGGLTTSTMTMSFLFNILLHYPRVQDKLQEEVDRVLGDTDAVIGTDMKSEMHFTQATLYELLRFSSILPFGLPHQTQEDVVIEGHLIPKDVIVLINTWYLHHSDHWDEPFEFKPERYLDEDGKFVAADHTNRIHWMPFGAGHRVCAGMVLALNRYFITISNVMRHFSVRRDTTRPLQSCDPRDGKPGIFLHGKSYTARFIPRR